MGACASSCVKEHDGKAASKQKASHDDQDNSVLGMSDSVVSVDSPRHKVANGKASNDAPSTAPTSNSQFIVDESALGAEGVVLDMVTPTTNAAATPKSQPQLTVSVPAIVAKLEQQAQKAQSASPRPITLHTRNLSAAGPAVPLDSPVAHTPASSSRPAVGHPPIAAQDSFAAPVTAATAEAISAVPSPMAAAAAAASPRPAQSPAAAAPSPKPAKSPAVVAKSAASPAARPFGGSPLAAAPKAATPVAATKPAMASPSAVAKPAGPSPAAEKSAQDAQPRAGASPVQLTASSGPRIRQPFAAAAPTANSLTRQRSAAQATKEESAIAMRASSLASFLPAPAKPLNRTESFEAKLAAKKAAKKKYKKTSSGKKLVK